MSRQPTTLEIISDTEAYAVRGEARLLITGGNARYIIAVYRHCLAHEGTGTTDAALFLWGVIAGMEHQTLQHAQATIESLQHQTLQHAQATIESLRLRRIDEEAP